MPHMCSCAGACPARRTPRLPPQPRRAPDSRTRKWADGRITQGALRRRASLSALPADASLSLRPWMTRTGKPAAAGGVQSRHSGSAVCTEQPPSAQACRARQPGQHTRTHARTHARTHTHRRTHTLHDGGRVPVAEAVPPAGRQLAPEAVRRLRGRPRGREVLPPQQLLPPPAVVRNLCARRRVCVRACVHACACVCVCVCVCVCLCAEGSTDV
jgi:hypothetical protein